MLTKFRLSLLISILIPMQLILAACQPPPAPLVVTEVVEATPEEEITVVTPTPEPAGPRTLVVCLDVEPGQINYIYGFTPYPIPVHEALFDGPIDSKSFDFQPVILEKLPSLADGDAILTKVTVSEGDTVADANFNLLSLDPAADPPIMLTPAGGGDPVPYLGGDFELDQMKVTFKLLPGLKWSDGVPLTAMDSVYAFNLAQELESNVIYEFTERTATYEAIDDLTIQWTGIPGFRDPMYSTYMWGPLSEHIWDQYSPAELDEMEEFYRTPVGWGPYMLEEWVEGESISLRKNPHYFRAAEGLPKFDRVIFRITGEDPNINIAALLAGECDIVSSLGTLGAPIERLLELHEASKLKASFTTGSGWEHLDFGIQHVDYDDGYQLGVDRPDFFSDVRTRQAFAMCIDRQALVDTIFYGQALVPDTYTPPQHPLYNPDVRHYDFDAAAGSALLEEVGWLDEDGDPDTPRVAQGVPNVPDGTSLEVDYETTSLLFRQQATAMIKDSLAQCGIKANIQYYPDFVSFSSGKVFKRRFDLAQFTLAFEGEPLCDLYLSQQALGPEGETWISIQDGKERTFYGWDAGWNLMGFANEEYDRVCSTALSYLPGQPEYEAGHLEAQRISAEQLPALPLFMWPKVIAMRPDMCGVIMDPSAWSAFWNIEEFRTNVAS
jgi:peptide/nickel transport system substrate-binding protein